MSIEGFNLRRKRFRGRQQLYQLKICSDDVDVSTAVQYGQKIAEILTNNDSNISMIIVPRGMYFGVVR